MNCNDMELAAVTPFHTPRECSHTAYARRRWSRERERERAVKWLADFERACAPSPEGIKMSNHTATCPRCCEQHNTDGEHENVFLVLSSRLSSQNVVAETIQASHCRIGMPVASDT